MAGCSIILILYIIVPMVIVLALIFLGAALGSVLTALVTTAVYLILNRKGFFAEYCRAEKAAVRLGAKLLRILLILTMAGAWLLTAASIVLVIRYL